ncbi:MAG TPA: hypothetical protein VFT12_02500 [Thermoanaerobaculia bacterium]|nr:hypothetical protein [Thermoanaerobaculia bacterium]
MNETLDSTERDPAAERDEADSAESQTTNFHQEELRALLSMRPLLRIF